MHNFNYRLTEALVIIILVLMTFFTAALIYFELDYLESIEALKAENTAGQIEHHTIRSIACKQK